MENSENKSKKIIINLKSIFGVILLIPPLLGVFLFLSNLNSRMAGEIAKLSNLSVDWTGGGDGHTSAAPIYLGLMAIAGALLLKDTDLKF